MNDASLLLTLDHLVVVAPDLAEGVAWVEHCLGVRAPEGGRHDGWGTRNHLMRIGDGLFLEIIAVDENQPEPARARQFGLGDRAGTRAAWAAGHRLRGYVARATDLDAALAHAGPGFGAPQRMSRGDLAWRFSATEDGALPHDGVAPYLMEWGPAGTPAGRMADLGCELFHFFVRAPEPHAVSTLLGRIGIAGAPEVKHGPFTRHYALFDTPSGPRLLT